MLRHKLLTHIGVLVVGFVGGAILAIVLLQMLLRDIERTDSMAYQITGSVDALVDSNALLSVQDESSLEPEMVRRLEERFDSTLESIRDSGWSSNDEGAILSSIIDLHSSQATTHGASSHRQLIPMLSQLREKTEESVAQMRLAFSQRLRWFIIGLTIAALFMANVSVLVLLRMGGIILRPVTALVEGSRHLANEEFSHRVEVCEPVEFGELARAYNDLAARLEQNEQRRMEVLQQLAVSLNHELNNVLGIIELQLGMLDRRSGYDRDMAVHFKQIRENLGRMARIVESLKHLRRIVVTEYPDGSKMLDLSKSVEADDEGGQVVPTITIGKVPQP
ncbi:MAG: HAMP domain-containing protein [Planctomycetota bacterium]|jgi:nitrate/nitrite-specific signal transduction histidine kinase